MIELNEENYTKQRISFTASMFASFSTAAIFHPLDRGLYLSIVNHRNFLNSQNFLSPLQGISVNCAQKTFGNGCYFFLQSELKDYLECNLPEDMQYRQVSKQLITGLGAGSISAILNNPFTSVKYYMWGREKNGYYQSAKEVWMLGGYKAFLRGTLISIIRDSVHGSIYELLRGLVFNTNFMQEFDKNTNCGYLLSNIFAATISLTISSPLNYLRSKRHHTCPSKSGFVYFEEMSKVFKNQVANVNYKSPLENLSIFNNTFKSNWGVARGVAGIVLTQHIADNTKSFLSNK